MTHIDCTSSKGLRGRIVSAMPRRPPSGPIRRPSKPSLPAGSEHVVLGMPRDCMRPSYVPRSQWGSGRQATADPGQGQAVADLGRRATFTLAPEPGRQRRIRFRPAGLDHGNTPTGWWAAYGKGVVSARG